MSTTCDTLCVKISSKSVHHTTRYCKVKVPYQSREKRGEMTCRSKIDHLNYGKRPLKHIWGHFALSGKSKEPILGAKFVFFVGLTCTYTKCTGHEMVKMGVCVSKLAEKKQKAVNRDPSMAHAESTSKSRSKLVHFTRRYSNLKVPYQMTNIDKYGSCFAKIHHLKYVILHKKYIIGENPHQLRILKN